MNTDYLKWRMVPRTIVKLAKEYDALPPESRFLDTENVAKGIRTAFNTARLGKGKDVFGIEATPNPLLSMLLGGVVGGGVGYAGGSLASWFLPPEWKKDRFKRTSTILGALAGAAPGAAFSGLNMIGGLPPWSDSMYKQAYHEELKLHNLDSQFQPAIEAFMQSRVKKQGSGVFGRVAVPVDDFNRVVWGDRRVSDLLSNPEKAAITGLVSGASHLPGRPRNGLVTPVDIGMMAAGMGSGYVSGALVGRGLTTLMGMPPETQDKLKTTGVWAGAIKGMIPLVF